MTKKRNKALYKRWDELSKQTINDKILYRYEAKLEMLSNEFFLQPETVRILLSKRP